MLLWYVVVAIFTFGEWGKENSFSLNLATSSCLIVTDFYQRQLCVSIKSTYLNTVCCAAPVTSALILLMS